jgi:PAS domain S-box-containing protein
MFKESSKSLKSKIQELENQLIELREKLAKTNSFDEILDGRDFTSKNVSKSVIDTEFTLIDVNDKRLKGTGLKRRDIVGKKCYQAFYGLSKPCDECNVKDVVISKTPQKFLRSYVDREQLHFEEKTVSPILNEFGETERLVVQSKDITNYYHLVDRADQREALYHKIFESAGDAFLVHDEEGRLIEFGSMLPKILGYTTKELKALKVKDIDDPTFSMDYKKRKDSIRNEGAAVFETSLICKSGKRLPVEVSANLIEIGKTNIFFVAIRNIEKRKLAEEKLVESEERFRTLVENAPDLIMRFDRDHKHLFVNSASRNVLKIAPEEFIGKTHFDMDFPPDLCKFWEDEMDKVFESGILNTVEFSLVIDDSLHYFEWQLIPEKNLNGENETLLAIARNITLRKESEIALNEAIKTKDKFFSIIAHDLKNPFNALLPISKTLEDNCAEMHTDQISELANLIHTSVKQEYNLLENLLEWSRAQMGKIKCTPKKIDLDHLITSNILLYEAKANKKDISIKKVLDKNLDALADEYMVDTIIRNLLSNALKFTHQHGDIVIKVSSAGETMTVEFTDTGIGISKENIRKLFRIDTNYIRCGTNDENGTGLGLILCKEFIEQNKGTISVTSRVGKGSTFKFTLPKFVS